MRVRKETTHHGKIKFNIIKKQKQKLVTDS